MDELFGWFMILLIVATIVAFALAAIVHGALILIVVFAIALPIIAIAKGVKWYAKKPKTMSFREYFRSRLSNWFNEEVVPTVKIGAFLIIVTIISAIPLEFIFSHLGVEEPFPAALAGLFIAMTLLLIITK